MTIANPHLSSPQEAHNLQLRKWASVASISVAVILIMVKFMAYMMTDSVSVMTSLMDSTFDAVASLVTMLGIIHAASPADEEHRFGHGKLESLAALGQAIFIFGSSGYLFLEAMHRFFHPQKIANAYVGVIVMVISLAMTAFLISFQYYVIKRTKSVAIKADYMHYRGDLLMNLSVFASLVLSYYSDWPYFDPLFAFVISISLLYGARAISMESFSILMDKELPVHDRETIEKLVKAHPAVSAIHDLRTRHSGLQVFIEFHLEVDGNLSLHQAHAITEEIEALLFDAFPKAEIMIHQEPSGIDDHRLDHTIHSNGKK